MSASYRSCALRSLFRWWGWQLLITTASALAVAARYYSVVEVDDSPASLAFRAIMLVAHFTALSAVLLTPALAAILIRAPAWIVLPLGALCSISTVLALLIDTQVYQLYRFHINAGVMNLLLGGAAAETFDFSASNYALATALAFAIIAASSLFAWWSWRYVRHTAGHPRLARVVIVALLSAILSFHGLHVWADASAREALLEQTDVLPLGYAATAKRSLRALGVDVRTRPLATRLPAEDRSGLAYPLYPLHCRPPTDELPNIVFIVIDSWRFDALDAQVTPNLHALARRSARFMDHHSGGNATRMGVFSLFYSIPGTYWHRMLAERQGPLFMTELLLHGYDVQAFRSAPLFSPEFDRTVFAAIDGVRLRSDGDDAAERDEDLTRDFLSYLDRRSPRTPFSALLFYDSPHKLAFPAGSPLPFQPSAADVNYLRLDSRTDAVPLHNRYRNSVHYVDGLIGRVVAAMNQRGLLDNSIIVVTGDHGQEFNDNGRNYWGHGSNFTRYQTGVPLILYSPGLRPAVYRHRTTHFDIVPTLLREHFGCVEPFHFYSVGQSLFEAGGREAIVVSEYRDFAIVTADKIAVVREQGMQVLDASYGAIRDRHLDPALIAMALEQKSRFYRRVRRDLE
jgi:membrane-anchored protein YejM (alkaline phosphatase superfamily)